MLTLFIPGFLKLSFLTASFYRIKNHSWPPNTTFFFALICNSRTSSVSTKVKYKKFKKKLLLSIKHITQQSHDFFYNNKTIFILKSYKC